jgi:hypothetical protein
MLFKNEVCLIFIIRFLLLNIAVKKSVTVVILSWPQTLIYLTFCVSQQHVCWQACVCVWMQGREKLKYSKRLILVDVILVLSVSFKIHIFLKNSQLLVFLICLKRVLICVFSQFEFLLVWWNCVEWIPGLLHGALFNCGIRVFIVWLQIICTAHSSYFNISFAKYFIVCRNWLLLCFSIVHKVYSE